MQSLILDVSGVTRASGVLGDAQAPIHDHNAVSQAGGKAADRQKLLLLKVGNFERVAVPLSLVARLEDLSLSRIERAAGAMAIQYRDRILPLLRAAEHIGGQPPQPELRDPVHTIVFADGEHHIGLIVDEIIDIVEDVIAVTEPSRCPGMFGSAVIGGKVTDFIDVSAVIRSFDSTWPDRGASVADDKTVLLADDSPFSRGLLRGYLEIAGHKVIEASDWQEAVAKLGSHSVDVVVTSLDLPGRGAFKLLDSIRHMPSQQNLPVLALTTNATQQAGHADCFSDYFSKTDRFAMLRSLDRLACAVDRTSVMQERPMLLSTSDA
jgi:two-component system, chemotaxis family, sensor kinase CheA